MSVSSQYWVTIYIVHICSPLIDKSRSHFSFTFLSKLSQFDHVGKNVGRIYSVRGKSIFSLECVDANPVWSGSLSLLLEFYLPMYIGSRDSRIPMPMKLS